MIWLVGKIDGRVERRLGDVAAKVADAAATEAIVDVAEMTRCEAVFADFLATSAERLPVLVRYPSESALAFMEYTGVGPSGQLRLWSCR